MEIYLNCIKDAFYDTAGILPVLFVIFIIIEFVEYYCFDRVNSFVRRSGALAPLIGALIASFPQCGFSIIASVLYVRGLITRGTLLTVYLSTSDEAIPVLLSDSSTVKLVFPIVIIKIIVGITAGCLIDYFFPQKLRPRQFETKIETQKGCCDHEITKGLKKELILHPIKHTLIISAFIFAVTVLINILFAKVESAQNIGAIVVAHNIFSPCLASIFGLIPNCAVSVAFILLLVKGVITFPAAISGLCANAGLGLLVLFSRNKDKKDSMIILALLVAVSALAGIFASCFLKFI